LGVQALLFSTLSTGKRLLVYRTVYRVGNVAAEKAMQSSYF